MKNEMVLANTDYSKREYLSVNEVAQYTGLSVSKIHDMVKLGSIKAQKSTSGQFRFKLHEIESFEKVHINKNLIHNQILSIEKNNTEQTVV